MNDNQGKSKKAKVKASSLSRRELLAAFLGVPVALAACRSSAAPRFPEGSIVGARSVVAADVEPYTIVAGNPARVIRRLEA